MQSVNFISYLCRKVINRIMLEFFNSCFLTAQNTQRWNSACMQGWLFFPLSLLTGTRNIQKVLGYFVRLPPTRPSAPGFIGGSSVAVCSVQFWPPLQSFYSRGFALPVWWSCRAFSLKNITSRKNLLSSLYVFTCPWLLSPSFVPILYFKWFSFYKFSIFN